MNHPKTEKTTDFSIFLWFGLGQLWFDTGHACIQGLCGAKKADAGGPTRRPTRVTSPPSRATRGRMVAFIHSGSKPGGCDLQVSKAGMSMCLSRFCLNTFRRPKAI